MNKKQVQKILKEIAKNNGVSVTEVRRDIELAFAEAHAKQNDAWNDIPCKGEIPTIEEFILHVILKIVRDTNEF